MEVIKKEMNLINGAKNTVIFDTTAALVIIPAIFAFNLYPEARSPLLFITLPLVFKLMYSGRIFAVVFFIVIIFT